MSKTALFISCLLLVVSPGTLTAFAQDVSSPDTTESVVSIPPDQLRSTQRYQEEDANFKSFDKEKWRSIVSGVDFREEKEELPEFSYNRSLPLSGVVLKWVMYILIGAAVLFLVYFVFKNISFERKPKTTPAESGDPSQPVEDITSLDTKALLQQAIAEGNLKLAVRIYYLWLLKELDGNSLIKWKKDKTNRDYLHELFGRGDLVTSFRKLTLSYESVWYGDHDIDSGSFRSLSGQFDAVLSSLNTEPASDEQP